MRENLSTQNYSSDKEIDRELVSEAFLANLGTPSVIIILFFFRAVTTKYQQLHLSQQENLPKSETSSKKNGVSPRGKEGLSLMIRDPLIPWIQLHTLTCQGIRKNIIASNGLLIRCLTLQGVLVDGINERR